MMHASSKTKFVGEEALAKKGVLTLDYPIKHGVVNDWDKMTDVWHHCFYN
jgi:actin